MSVTALGGTLTRAYRAELQAQAARVARVVSAAWTGVEPGRIDASMARALPHIAAAIVGGQGEAALLSWDYLRRFIAAELRMPLDDVDVPLADLDWLVGRTITGSTVQYAVGWEPIHAKRLIAKGRAAEEAVAMCLRNLQATGRSELYRAARESVTAHAAATEYVQRYRRIASPSSCVFCRMLAGRGAVYRLETSGFRAHRNCHCTAEPVVLGTRASAAA